jgi:hypothetical protein
MFRIVRLLIVAVLMLATFGPAPAQSPGGASALPKVALTPAEPGKLPASITDVAPEGESIECGAEAFKRFVVKVQPILMNACASCHVRPNVGKFRLERTYIDTLNSRAATLRNLNMTLAQLDRSKPAASPLLRWATTNHGGGPLPPFRDRSAPAYKQLDEWVRLTVGDSPGSEPKAETVGATATTPAGSSEFGTAKPKADTSDGPKDPFDPSIFNRRHHPDRSPPNP